MRKQISEIARGVPGIIHTVEFTGYSGLDGTNRNNTVTAFLTLAPFEERIKNPRLTGVAITGAVRQKFAQIQDARVLVFPPPPVRGIGNAGGFNFESTVMPFIIRGVSLLGIASAGTARDIRGRVWQHLAGDWKPRYLDRIATREITLEQLPEVFERMLSGDSFGRTIVRVGHI